MIYVAESTRRKLIQLAKTKIRHSLTTIPDYAFYRRGAANALRENPLCPLGSTARLFIERAVKEMINDGEIIETSTDVVYPPNHPLHPKVEFDGVRLS